jgi:hypothetical protein
MRETPLYAILSGFEPDDTLGVGTVHDFFQRLCSKYFIAHKGISNGVYRRCYSK